MNSRAKYEELIQEEQFVDLSPTQRVSNIIIEIVAAASKAGTLENLLSTAQQITNNAPKLSPVIIFQIAADETTVDQLCN
jgi:hypothetical protein